MVSDLEGKDAQGSSIGRFHASSDRADKASLESMARSVLEVPLFPRALDSMPCPAVVLNKERQIVYANPRMLAAVNADCLEEVVGKRPGEAVGCVHADEGPAGCGTSEACGLCGAVNAILECQKTGETVIRECRISIDSDNENALDFEVVASSFNMSEGPVTVCALRDISSEKRRQVLERVFFHDVLNTAGGLQGLTQILMEDLVEIQGDDAGNLRVLASLAESLVQEIREHRQLLLAETGELRVQPGLVSSRETLREIHALLSNHEVGRNRILTVGADLEVSLETDADLLRRVLVNMTKNALEATPPGGTVTITCGDLSEWIAFHVHNASVMPEEVRLQVFHRSFSTKAGAGHGIGTYSMKLLGERYLHGRVSFISEPATGTTFTIEVPREWRG